MAVVIATSVRETGEREVIGLDVGFIPIRNLS